MKDNKNKFAETLKKYGISNGLAAKILNVKTSTVVYMKCKQWARVTSEKGVDDRIDRVLKGYVDHVIEQLNEDTFQIILMDLKKDICLCCRRAKEND